MRKLLSALAITTALLGGLALAQDATLSAPVARTSESKYILRDVSFSFTTSTANIEVTVQDAGSSDIRVIAFQVPDASHPSGTFTAFLAAVGTVRATETGTATRKANFRVLGFLFDNGYLPAATLNP